MSCQCGAPPLPQNSGKNEYASLDEAFKEKSSRKNLTTFEKILILVIIIILFLLYKGTKA